MQYSLQNTDFPHKRSIALWCYAVYSLLGNSFLIIQSGLPWKNFPTGPNEWVTKSPAFRVLGEWNTVINRKKKRKKISDVNVRMKGLCTAWSFTDLSWFKARWREMEIKAKLNIWTAESSRIFSSNYKSYLWCRLINYINSHNVILIFMYLKSMSVYLVCIFHSIFWNVIQLNLKLRQLNFTW